MLRLAAPLIALLLAGCTSAGQGSTTTFTASTTAVLDRDAPEATTTTTQVVDRVEAPGSLVVLDTVGRVVVMNSDGSEDRSLTSPDDGLAYFQPIWSPDAKMIAAGVGALGTPGLALVDVTDGSVEIVPASSAVFYASWSPDGSQVAFLNNGTGGDLDMTVHDVATGSSEIFGRGTPFYFSWSPAGDALASHVGFDVMDLTSEDGTIRSLAPPGMFQAPQWTEVGVFHIGLSGEEQLLLLTGDESIPLGLVSGRSFFSATTDGSRVAVATVSPQQGVTARLQSVPRLPANQLIVLDVATGEWETVSRDPQGAFFWSPDGEQLLVLQRSDGEAALVWSVWDGDLRTYEPFSPAPGFVGGFLPFFDQYAQSMTLWAPDGSAFAYPAVSQGVSSIWVQNVDGEAPVRIADGSWVAWSKK